MATIGTQLQTARKTRGLTQQAVADALHVTRQTISNWELGRSYPDAVSLIACSDFYHLSLDEMLKGDAKIMDDLKHNEQERQSAKAMYRGAYIVNLILLGLLLMHQSHIGEVTMGDGTRIGFALVMAINLVVLLYATRNYRHIRGPLSPQANKRRWWLASIVGIIMIGLLYLAFKETLGLTWLLFGVAVGFAGLYILTRHFW